MTVYGKFDVGCGCCGGCQCCDGGHEDRTFLLRFSGFADGLTPEAAGVAPPPFPETQQFEQMTGVAAVNKEVELTWGSCLPGVGTWTGNSIACGSLTDAITVAGVRYKIWIRGWVRNPITGVWELEPWHIRDDLPATMYLEASMQKERDPDDPTRWRWYFSVETSGISTWWYVIRSIEGEGNYVCQGTYIALTRFGEDWLPQPWVNLSAASATLTIR